MLRTCRDLVARGALAEAETRLGAYLRTHPEDAEALTLLGATLVKAGRSEEAIHPLEAALAHDPDRAETLVWLGAAHRTLGRPEAAIPPLLQAVELAPDDAEALNLLGSCQLALGQADEAESTFHRAVALQPGSAAAHANLGMALRLQNRGEASLAEFQRALELEPERPAHHLQAFKGLQAVGRPDEALAAIQRGVARHPGSAVLAEALAAAYGRLGRAAEAEAIFRRIALGSPSGANAYAAWLQEAGRFGEAADALRGSLRLQPLQGAPYRNLAEMGETLLDGHPLLAAALALTDAPGLDEPSRMHLAYAVGKLSEKSGEYEAAMQSFDAANAIAYRTYPAPRTFDPAWTAREPEAIAELYDPEFFGRVAGEGSPDARPIFIVGMVRSGTTLLDRIVSAHPAVASVGEGTFWNAEADALHPRWRSNPPEGPELRDLATRYLRSIGDPPDRFTDKMPLNYRNLGPIHTVFPNARVLHIRRDPLDTALSILQTFFAGGPSFAYSRANVVAFYRAYRRHMAHWRATLPPDRLFELDYEVLVENPEPTIRAVLDFLGLPWDDACLRHERNEGAVDTPSRWQARQPIYRSSVARWRRYEPWLGELAELREEA